MVQRWNGENDATAVLVAILLVVFFGAAAVAVDLGAAWDTKRGLLPDTDAMTPADSSGESRSQPRPTHGQRDTRPARECLVL